MEFDNKYRPFGAVGEIGKVFILHPVAEYIVR